MAGANQPTFPLPPLHASCGAAGGLLTAQQVWSGGSAGGAVERGAAGAAAGRPRAAPGLPAAGEAQGWGVLLVGWGVLLVGVVGRGVRWVVTGATGAGPTGGNSTARSYASGVLG
jgi:hypothetical protein